jgi:hypothetical protein
MAGEVLRKKARTPKIPRGLAPAKPIGRGALIERRDRCMSELARLCQNESASGALADKATHLLTAHWSASSWRARSDILRTAEWLLGISRKTARAVPPPGGQNAQHRLDPVVS